MISTIITSKKHSSLDWNTVRKKAATGNFRVIVSPEFTIYKKKYRLLLDGHCSFEAARNLGIESEIIEAAADEYGQVDDLLKGRIDSFLRMTWHGEEYRYIQNMETAGDFFVVNKDTGEKVEQHMTPWRALRNAIDLYQDTGKNYEVRDICGNLWEMFEGKAEMIW